MSSAHRSFRCERVFGPADIEACVDPGSAAWGYGALALGPPRGTVHALAATHVLLLKLLPTAMVGLAAETYGVLGLPLAVAQPFVLFATSVPGLRSWEGSHAAGTT